MRVPSFIERTAQLEMEMFIYLCSCRKTTAHTLIRSCRSVRNRIIGSYGFVNKIHTSTGILSFCSYLLPSLSLLSGDMYRPTQGNSHSITTRKLTSSASSIINRLTSRSIVGGGLGIDIHVHSDMLHMFWKGDGATGCYKHYLERRSLEESEDFLIRDYIATTGLFGACECLSSWLPVPEDSPLHLCIFWSGHIFHPLHPDYRKLRKMGYPMGHCRCPYIDPNQSKKRDVTMTIFCLNRHLQISTRVSHHPDDVTRAHYFLLSDRIRFF